MVNQQYDGYDGAEKEEWVGTLVDREEPVKGNRHGCCAGKGKAHGIMYRKLWNHDGFERWIRNGDASGSTGSAHPAQPKRRGSMDEKVSRIQLTAWH